MPHKGKGVFQRKRASQSNIAYTTCRSIMQGFDDTGITFQSLRGNGKRFISNENERERLRSLIDENTGASCGPVRLDGKSNYIRVRAS